MASNNTVKSQVAGTIQNTLAPLSGKVISTTETAFSLNPGAVTGKGGGVVPLAPDATAQVIGSLSQAGIYFGTGRIIRVRAIGTAFASATETLVLSLYQVPASVVKAGIPANLAGCNKLASSSARSIDDGAVAFTMVADVQCGGNGKLMGSFSATINDLVDSQAAITEASGLTSEADLGFILTATLGDGDDATVVSLVEFNIDAV